MLRAQNIEITVKATGIAEIQKASDQNLPAAELHEAAAWYHRAAAQSLRQCDNEAALESAEEAHLKCNEAFTATIVAHKLTAGDHC
jgi:hypothetical protein